MKNQTNRSNAVALCAVAIFALLAPALQAGSGPFQNKIALDERDKAPVIDPIVQPGGDPISNPGSGVIVRPIKGPIKIEPIKVPPIKNPRS